MKTEERITHGGMALILAAASLLILVLHQITKVPMVIGILAIGMIVIYLIYSDHVGLAILNGFAVVFLAIFALTSLPEIGQICVQAAFSLELAVAYFKICDGNPSYVEAPWRFIISIGVTSIRVCCHDFPGRLCLNLDELGYYVRCSVTPSYYFLRFNL